MNMLRVWGGGMYEDAYFYDLCDSLGILVWQDFMFTCATYPGDETFMESVALEATQQIKRLRKHPSIALWCGNNENSQNLFNKLLPNLVDSLSTIDYRESSLQCGRENPKQQFAELFENFEKKAPRFMSEYGFQSFPEKDAMELYALEEDLFLDSEVMKAHQKHPGGNSIIKEHMLRYYKEPAEFESFIYLSQVLQAEGMKNGLETHRRVRPYHMGTLNWQLNDCWPGTSSSGIDYYGNWKALHYAAQRAYENLLISTVQSEDSVLIYILNDYAEDQECDLLIEHVDYYGNRMGSRAKYTTVDGASSKLAHSIVLDEYLYLDSIENQSYLDIQVLQNSEVKARKLHHFVKTKDMNLPYTGISYKVEKDSLGFILEIFSDAFMKDLMINSLHDGRFEDNYFDLPANEHRRIRFYNKYPMEEFNVNNLTFYSIVDTYE
jgi:beta-mannosidase